MQKILQSFAWPRFFEEKAQNSSLRRVQACAAVLATLLVNLPARAEACESPGGYSPCVDADTLWLAPGRSRFVGLESARVLSKRQFVAGLGATYLVRPVELHVASPDPDGRTIAVVDDALNVTAFAALGLGANLELDAALPFTVFQTGAGVQGVTTQDASPLAAQALRDPRLGASYELLRGSTPWAPSGKLTLRAALPLGTDDALAGDRSFVIAPGSTWTIDEQPFFAALQVGARLRRVTELGGARVGSQLTAGLGFGVDVLAHELLTFSAEATLLPGLASQSHAAPDGTRSTGRLIPSEWLLSARSRPLRSTNLSVQLGAGMGIPLSSEERSSPAGSSASEHFAGVTTPRFRGVLVLRYLSELGSTPAR